MIARRAALMLAAAAFVVSALAGCGDDGGGDGGDTAAQDGSTTTLPGPGPDADAGAEELAGTMGAEIEGRIALTGTAEVPPTSVAADVVAHIRIEPNRLCVTVPLDELGSAFTGAHIHQAPARENGPVAVDLTATHDPDAAELDGCVELEPEIHDALRADPGRFYLNVHTEEHPDGAVRGQLDAIEA